MIDGMIFSDNGIEVIRRGNRYFVRYDAGSHQIALREDEISEADLIEIRQGPSQATRVLFSLQNKLAAKGEDPYRTNLQS